MWIFALLNARSILFKISYCSNHRERIIAVDPIIWWCHLCVDDGKPIIDFLTNQVRCPRLITFMLSHILSLATLSTLMSDLLYIMCSLWGTYKRLFHIYWMCPPTLIGITAWRRVDVWFFAISLSFICACCMLCWSFKTKTIIVVNVYMFAGYLAHYYM